MESVGRAVAGVQVGFSLNKPGWCSFQDPVPFFDFLASAGVGAVELPLAVSGEFDQGVAEAALARGLVITFHLVWKREAGWKWYRGWGKRTGRAGLDSFLATLDELAGRQGAPVLVVIHPLWPRPGAGTGHNGRFVPLAGRADEGATLRSTLGRRKHDP